MLQATRNTAPNGTFNHVSFGTVDRMKVLKTCEGKGRNFLMTFHEGAEGD